MNRLKTVELVTIALVAAILCILSPISIPLGFSPIPITLSLFCVVLAGIILGRKKGTICVLLYILIGAVGVPVFSGYSGGFQKILGPSGGYIWGYLLLVWVTGLFSENCRGSRLKNMAGTFCGAVVGTAFCYTLGTIWMGCMLHMTPAEALWAGVIPFLPFDLIKILIAVTACCPVRQILLSQGLIRGKIH